MEPAQHQGSSSQSLQNGSSRVRFAEEDPGLEAVHSQFTLRAREKAAVETAPEVYWDDDRSDGANLSQYTFYREGTPTPPDYEEVHKQESGYEAGAVAGGSTSRTGGGFPPDQHGHGGEDWSSTSSNQVVCGIRKTTFWTIIALIILIVIALALGVGLGVGLNTSRTEAPPPAPSSTLSSSPAISDSAGDSSSTLTTSSSSGSSGTTTPTCPAANNTLYTSTAEDDSKKTFLRLCGTDYSGVGGAKDLKSIYTGSMDECMDMCASVSDCTGCGWGNIHGDSGSSHRCWLKTNVETGHNATQDWIFAILQTK